MAPDTPHENDPAVPESAGRAGPADWLSRAVDWTRRTLQSEYRENRELAELLEQDREELLNLWIELSVASGYQWSSPPDAAQDRQIVDLCLARLISALGSEAAVFAGAEDDEEVFSFAATLAEYATRERIGLDDLIQNVLLLRRAIHLQLRKYGGVSAASSSAVDWFTDTAVIALTRRWLSANQASAQWEESRLSGLLSVSHEMLSTLDQTAAATALVSQARELAQADGAALLIRAAEDQHLLVTASATASDSVHAAPVPLHSSASGTAVRTGEPVTGLDLGGDHPPSAFHGSAPLPQEPAALMCAPVRVAGTVIGSLEVANFERRIYTPEQINMLRLLADQAGLLWENAERHRRSLEDERARTLREIQMAQKVQRALLTSHALEHGALSIGACLEPSREVGGDYYDFFLTGADSRQVAIHIGDVSGKGIPAALLVAMAKYVVRSHALPEVPAPGEVLRKTNETFCSDLSEEMAMFVTACYALVDCEGRELRYASAGHPPPLIIRGSLMQTVEERSGAAPLNLLPEQTFPERRVSLCPGDMVILYTDGVPEARDSSGKWFGLDGLKRALRHCREEEPPALARSLVAAVRAFQGGQPLADDTTVVVLKVRGK